MAERDPGRQMEMRALLPGQERELFASFASLAARLGCGRHLALQEPAWREFLPILLRKLADFLAEPAQQHLSLARQVPVSDPFHDIPGNLGLEAVPLFLQESASFAAFFPLLKCLRRVCLDMSCEPDDGQEAVLRRSGVELFFDRLETAAALQWRQEESAHFHRRLRETRHFILREKKRYATIFHKMAEPALILDQHLCIMDANGAFEAFFRLPPQEVIGRPCTAVLGRDFCDTCFLGKVLAEYGSFSRQEVKLMVRGEQRTVLVSGSSLGFSGAESPGGIVVFQDISEKKRMEQALLESEAKFRTLIENVPDVVWRADPQGNFLYVSPNVKRLCGLEPEELMGRSRLSLVFPADQEMVRKKYELLFSRGKEMSTRYRLRGKGGRWLWVHDRARPTSHAAEACYADGVFSDVTRLQKVEAELAEYRAWLEELVEERTREVDTVNEQLLREVTERQQTQQALERLTVSLSRSNAELEQFAHVASHDMKEPLLLIVAFAERLLARWGGSPDERGVEYIRRILKAAGQLQMLVDDILQLCRVDSELRGFAAVDLAPLLREVCDDLEERIRRSGGVVRLGELAVVQGDRVQLRQLFQNLLSNALKYRKEDVPPLVEVRSRLLPGRLCEITVQDNGIGFAEEEAVRIFQPFVRLHGRDKYEGSGMGLTTCEKIVTRHSGRISARSRPGHGSIFIIHLPLAATSSAAEKSV